MRICYDWTKSVKNTTGWALATILWLATLACSYLHLSATPAVILMSLHLPDITCGPKATHLRILIGGVRQRTLIRYGGNPILNPTSSSRKENFPSMTIDSSASGEYGALRILELGSNFVSWKRRDFCFWLIVCLFDCMLLWLYAALIVRLFDCSIVCLFCCMLVCLCFIWNSWAQAGTGVVPVGSRGLRSVHGTHAHSCVWQ